jgi:hypothetical protein
MYFHLSRWERSARWAEVADLTWQKNKSASKWRHLINFWTLLDSAYSSDSKRRISTCPYGLFSETNSLVSFKKEDLVLLKKEISSFGISYNARLISTCSTGIILR